MSHVARRQGGAALLVAMVMIFMLSIMGVSVMRNSTLEKRMATNAIQSSVALQAAESATELMLNSSTTLTLSGNDFQKVVEVDTGDIITDVPLTATSEIIYLGSGPAFGFSPEFRALRYVVQGDVSIDSARSRAIVRQGAYRIAPAPQMQ